MSLFTRPLAVVPQQTQSNIQSDTSPSATLPNASSDASRVPHFPSSTLSKPAAPPQLFPEPEALSPSAKQGSHVLREPPPSGASCGGLRSISFFRAPSLRSPSRVRVSFGDDVTSPTDATGPSVSPRPPSYVPEPVLHPSDMPECDYVYVDEDTLKHNNPVVRPVGNKPIPSPASPVSDPCPPTAPPRRPSISFCHSPNAVSSQEEDDAQIGHLTSRRSSSGSMSFLPYEYASRRGTTHTPSQPHHRHRHSSHFSAPSAPSHSASLYPSTPVHPSQPSATHTPRSSLGTRIRRSLSLSLSHSYSEAGHENAFVRPANASLSFTTGTNCEPQDIWRPHKLRKRMPMPEFTSVLASPPEVSLHEPGCKLGGKRHSWSFRSGTPPPLLTSPVAPSPTHLTPQSPLPTPVQRLTKRFSLNTNAETIMDATLPQPRTVSPLNVDLRGSPFSHAARSHSTPNFDTLVSTPPQSPPYMTESPPPSPQMSLPLPGPSTHQAEPVPEHPSFPGLQPSRRWTLAVSEMSDERLVQELDRLRGIGWGLGFQGELVRVKHGGRASDDGSGDVSVKWEKDELEEWLIARRALMLCREIVRTERNYREGIVRLQHSKAPRAEPPLLWQYLPALISTSEAFSSRLDEDLSVWGVSAAFLGVEDALEAALVAWSGIVGEFFTTIKGKRHIQWGNGTSAVNKQRDKEKREKESKVAAGAPALLPMGSSDHGHGHAQPLYVGTKRASSWRMSMPTLSQLWTSMPEAGLNDHKPRHQRASSSRAPSGSAKTPTVQDLAIQPTQRVMRYVLLYKDLRDLTPIASPARPLVESALEGATRIAQRCNRAQDNAAFLT